MKYSQVSQGRVFVIRLEDGDIIHEEIEALAEKEAVQAATLTIFLGGDQGGRLVVGPEDGRSGTITQFRTRMANQTKIISGKNT